MAQRHQTSLFICLRIRCSFHYCYTCKVQIQFSLKYICFVSEIEHVWSSLANLRNSNVPAQKIPLSDTIGHLSTQPWLNVPHCIPLLSPERCILKHATKTSTSSWAVNFFGKLEIDALEDLRDFSTLNLLEVDIVKGDKSFLLISLNPKQNTRGLLR